MPVINRNSCSKEGCDKTLNVIDEIICDKCRSGFHATCTGLSRSEIQQILAKGSRIFYLCFHCDAQTSRGSTPIQSSTFERSLIELREFFTRELELLRSLINQKNANDSTFSKEEVICEVAERQRRASNVIIFNVDECLSHQDANARKEKDNQTVLDIISSLSFRLGRLKPDNKPRPIKVILRSSNEAIELLKNKYKLKKVTVNFPSQLIKPQPKEKL
ncbi:hypothetical protein PPYR_09384 [Photinus pyralis]|uniref:Zinc finger PHD-type domain-containing protein n=1 Tax=Photinus pyralis TaxID=7054 RepID=A0A5N4AM55_PHOPY|nr:hypothetical protein PPYR_09384 [Photinus pyralis]